MGAFFLYKKDSAVLAEEAEKIFNRKGFSQPNKFDLGEWKLLLYKKIAVEVDNYAFKENYSLFSCGTVVYKGLGYCDSLNKLLEDLISGSVNQDDLIGHFCLLFWDGQNLTALTDQLNTYHVFYNDKKTVLTSSFLAALSSSPNKLPLNRLALCEKLSAGYIVSPDTLVDGIWQIDDEGMGRFSLAEHNISFIKHLAMPEIKMHSQGKEESLNKQIEVLQRHFAQLDNINTEFGGDLGLSDGYDSRLLLACSLAYLRKPLTLHTHATSGVHDSSKAIVEAIVKYFNLRLNSVETRQLEKLSAKRVQHILEDGLMFFDSRSSHNMGAMSETYTREYKIKTIAGSKMSFNGLGGEIYRNYYESRRCGKIDFSDWLNYNVFYPFAPDVIGNRIFSDMAKYKISKVKKRLGNSCKEKVDFFTVRRYYSEVRMPDCDANNSDAQNQVTFYHMPFIQPKIISEGLAATNYIGLGGSYQSKLINRINAELSSFNSHYGYAFDKRMPLKYLLRSALKELAPVNILSLRIKEKLEKKSNITIDETSNFIESQDILKIGRDILLEKGLISNFDYSLIHYAQRPTALYICSFLSEFNDKIK
ncbi:hypothetical protein [Sedimentisphaera salicampi]|uniref:hypothetical protein n=1 Tax=Sedimentisphaera salicampi TaxID=1941349 RepID=UPI000B9AC13F|nr:hypothetical protein [Sedimentisphaera salicampi]OXU15572.1 hypothetical protein SMSP1_00654 [Sedimentisphaera salicampi]